MKTVRCPKCNHNYKVNPNKSGLCKCPHCNTCREEKETTEITSTQIVKKISGQMINKEQKGDD